MTLIHRVWGPFRRFWATDSGLSILLFLLVIVIFVFPAFGTVDTLGRIVLDGLFTLLMLAGVASIGTQRGAQVAVGGITVIGLAIRWSGELAPSPATELATALFALLSIATLTAVVLFQVFRAGTVNRHRILGAIAVYLLLGLAWGEAYYAVALVDPAAFAASGTLPSGPQGWAYYSFVTLTTVGYGDIAPVAATARSLAMLEALTGQLYPAILLARLVALELGARADR